MAQTIYSVQHEASEWGYRSGKQYHDPFNEIELDVEVRGPSGKVWRVPAYWAGGDDWRVRFAAPEAGSYTFQTVCSDSSNPDLHGQAGQLVAAPYQGQNPLLKHGPLQVSATRRALEHADGKPFFWLGDTWWMGLCSRMKWPEGFQTLTADRAAKGFSVIQIVAGLYPDMPGFDPRGVNEAGFPWEAEYARINPAYFDQADQRIQWLVSSGLVPCIVACWGYYLPLLGEKKMKQHWRNLVARWGAYPVVWCLAGEAAMPYYLSKGQDQDRALQIEGWTELGRYLRQIDPYRRPVTIHPTQVGRDQVTDDTVLDINMLQTGHGNHWSLSNTVAAINREVRREPAMPALVGEVSYEGFLHYTGEEVQRLTFWSSVLSGAMGHTYGANGIWQVNTREKPYGPSPHGGTWGNMAWEDAYQLPGSKQLGLAKKLLERYAWQTFQPHPDWVDPCGSPEHVEWPFAAGNDQVRIIYIYGPDAPWEARKKVKQLEPGQPYRAFFWDPRTGEETHLGLITGQSDGTWTIPFQPEMNDWVLVLEKEG